MEELKKLFNEYLINLDTPGKDVISKLGNEIKETGVNAVALRYHLATNTLAIVNETRTYEEFEKEFNFELGECESLSDIFKQCIYKEYTENIVHFLVYSGSGSEFSFNKIIAKEY